MAITKSSSPPFKHDLPSVLTPITNVMNLREQLMGARAALGEMMTAFVSLLAGWQRSSVPPPNAQKFLLSLGTPQKGKDPKSTDRRGIARCI